jgi:cysteine-rich repeat protein
MKRIVTLLFMNVVVIGACGGDSNNSPDDSGTCSLSDCVAACLAAGRSGGSCVDGACVCTHTSPVCGNGVLERPGEQCDNGTDNSDTVPDACRTTCVPAHCGDEVVDTGEACDDGMSNSDTVADACRTTCAPARCGDGVVDAGEACDAGMLNSDTAPNACRTTCVAAHCGDEVVDTGEACDDGNTVSGDGCKNDCSFTCTTAAECDDGVFCTGSEICGADHTCANGTPPYGASCTLSDGRTGICRSRDCIFDCPTTGAYADCGGASCASLLSEPANCGACSTACGAGQVCTCGTCTDACSDPNTDAANCGICGGACEAGDVCCCGICMAMADCPAACTMVPFPHQELCGVAGNACVDLRNDMLNCGACGTVCPSEQRCGDGVCTSETCTAAEVHCDGHCTDITSSSQNCGRCGNACDLDREVCVDGGCRVSG